MTMNCYYDSVVDVTLPVENIILPIVHLILKLTTPLFKLFASGKNGSTPVVRTYTYVYFYFAEFCEKNVPIDMYYPNSYRGAVANYIYVYLNCLTFNLRSTLWYNHSTWQVQRV